MFKLSYHSLVHFLSTPLSKVAQSRGALYYFFIDARSCAERENFGSGVEWKNRVDRSGVKNSKSDVAKSEKMTSLKETFKLRDTQVTIKSAAICY